MDEKLFRLINEGMKHEALDRVIPLFSDKDLLIIPLLAASVVLAVLGGRRARIAVLGLVLAVAIADYGSEKGWKRLFERPRPYGAMAEVNVHRGDAWREYGPLSYSLEQRKTYSFPSSHASNIAALAVVFAFLARRTLWITVPLALAVGFSRVYTGQHYAFDVLGGYVWGTAAGFLALAVSRATLGRWLKKDAPPPEPMPEARRAFLWLLGLWAFGNFVFLHLGLFDLAGDEAQYWDWSRRLALGYYSKPPLIAYANAIFVAIGGNTEWAIRSCALFMSCASAALVYALTLRIARRENAALLAAAVGLSLPTAAAGATLITPDALLIGFWSLALYAFHRAVSGDRAYWVITGLALGGGLLAKYTMAVLIVSFAIYLVGFDRRWLRHWGPYAALSIAAASLSGVIYWNWRNDWASFRHTAGIGAEETLAASQSLRNLGEYVGGQFGVVTPIVFGFLAWAVWLCLRRSRRSKQAAFLAATSLTLFALYAAVSLRNRTQPQWGVGAYPAALVALGVIWTSRPRPPWAQWLLAAGVLLAFTVSVAARSTELFYLLGRPAGENHQYLQLGNVKLRAGADPTNELQGGEELGAALTEVLREESRDGTIPFVCSDRYAVTALAAFYTKGRPRTYCVNMGGRRLNQYDLWGGWDELTGRDAIFVTGGDASRAYYFIQALTHKGAFDDGRLLEIVDVHRSGVVIRRFAICLLENYTGYDWRPENPDY